eukprot:gene17826-19607_t
MSFKRTFIHHDRTCLVDITQCQNASQIRDKLQEIRTKSITKLILFTDNLHILSDNVSYLASSLTELKIRPKPSEELTEEDRDDGWSSPSIGDDTIPNEIGNLEQLKIFFLNNNGIYPQRLMTILSQLSIVQALDLWNCGIEEFHLNTQFLSKSLTYLNLGQNKLTRIPQELFKLELLGTLILAQNNISEVSRDLSHLKQLTKLDLSYNKISNFPAEICKLESLSKLYLTGNKIELIPKELTKLTCLAHLELNNNLIRTLPETFGNLFNLRLVDLTSNKLTALPESICNLKIRDDALLLSGNPFHKPPLEVCLHGIKAIEGYFEACKKCLSINCKRLKMILIGETMAGKTSLAKALVEGRDANVTTDERTIGLDNYFWRPNPHESELEILIVDCAGQRKYLLTHQFFFTEGAIFLLVVNLKQYSKAEDYHKYIGYWINLTTSQVPGALIQIVPTHLDEFQDSSQVKDICNKIIDTMRNEEKAKLKYLDSEIEKVKQVGNSDLLDKLILLKRNRPHLPDCCYLPTMTEELNSITGLKIIPVSCKNQLDGLLCLKDEILRIVNDSEMCPHVEKELPDSWISFKNKVQALKGSKGIPVVTRDELAKMAAEEFGFTEQMFASVLSYLNKNGSLAHFDKVERGKHLVFIDVSWLIKRLQLIFRHDLDDKLCFKDSFIQFETMEQQFLQEKRLLIKNGIISKSLLRCIWEDIGHDLELIEHLVEILDHFNIICQPQCCNVSTEYFITWYLAESMSANVKKSWEKFDSETEDQLLTRVEIRNCELPSSIFERYIVDIQRNSAMCMPWKSGFYAVIDNCRVLCQLSHSKHCSEVTLHGRFKKDLLVNMWEVALKLWKRFDILLRENNGCLWRATYSICNQCTKHAFRVDWCRRSQQELTIFNCYECAITVDVKFIMPPQDVIQFIDKIEFQTLPKGPLNSRELSKVADWIGPDHTRLACRLGVDQSVISNAQYNWPRNVYEQAMEVLNNWIKVKGDDANKEAMVSALREVKPPSMYKIILYLYTGNVA